MARKSKRASEAQAPLSGEESGDAQDALGRPELSETESEHGAALERNGAHAPAEAAPHGESLPARVTGFVRGCWRELKRVQWPDRRQVFQATGVVLGFVIVAGAFLGVASLVAEKIVNLILYGHG